MRTLSAVLLTVCVAACSSRQSSTTLIPVQSPEVVSVQTGDGTTKDVRIVREDFIAQTDISAPRAAVWAAVPAVYQELGLPAPKQDHTRLIAQVENFTVSRLLGNERLSKYLSCGAGISGDYADTRRIRLTVRTSLEAAGEGHTTVFSRVEAIATSTEGASAQPINCFSRGPLEAAIANKLRARVAGSGTP